MSKARYAILLDGGFLTKKLYVKLGNKHATADDIVAECERLQNLTYVADYELLRIYYYDAFPSKGDGPSTRQQDPPRTFQKR